MQYFKFIKYARIRCRDSAIFNYFLLKQSQIIQKLEVIKILIDIKSEKLFNKKCKLGLRSTALVK